MGSDRETRVEPPRAVLVVLVDLDRADLAEPVSNRIDRGELACLPDPGHSSVAAQDDRNGQAPACSPGGKLVAGTLRSRWPSVSRRTTTCPSLVSTPACATPYAASSPATATGSTSVNPHVKDLQVAALPSRRCFLVALEHPYTETWCEYTRATLLEPRVCALGGPHTTLVLLTDPESANEDPHAASTTTTNKNPSCSFTIAEDTASSSPPDERPPPAASPPNCPARPCSADGLLSLP